jgi:predicted membrane protein
LLPLFILGFVELSKLGEDIKTSVRVLSASLVLIGVFAMRWNVVIGGQLISKSLRGFMSYTPPLLGIEGILVAAVFMILPFVIFAMIIYLIPPWEEEIKLPKRRRFSFESLKS